MKKDKANSVKKGRNEALLVGLKLTGTNYERVLNTVKQKLAKFGSIEAKYKPFYIVTPNPEIFLMARKDPRLMEIINASDVSLPDGIGLVMAYKYLNHKNKITDVLQIKQVKGRLVFASLLKEASDSGWRIFLTGGSTTLKAGSEIKKRYPDIKIEYLMGPKLNEKGDCVDIEANNDEINLVKAINNFKPHLLFVGFGAPKQEKWIARNMQRLNIGGAMVIGGVLDEYGGKRIKTPTVVSNLGLEWLLRLVTGNTNWVRIKRAVIDFPLFIYKYKLAND